MRASIEVRGPVASPALRAQATDRITRLLARFGIHSTTARAVFVHPKKYFIAKRLLATRGLRQTRRASRAD